MRVKAQREAQRCATAAWLSPNGASECDCVLTVALGPGSLW